MYKVVNIHYSTIQFFPKCCKTQEMCDKAFNKYFLAFIYISDRYKTQDMGDSIIFKDSFSIRYIPDQHKTQQMCYEAVDDCLAALKFVSD